MATVATGAVVFAAQQRLRVRAVVPRAVVVHAAVEFGTVAPLMHCVALLKTAAQVVSVSQESKVSKAARVLAEAALVASLLPS